MEGENNQTWIMAKNGLTQFSKSTRVIQFQVIYKMVMF